ncbi:MAG: addiction module protein [Rhodoferax sp.]|nr:addiction module protein [Betaproteobacteria bacterium]NCN97669.1 addiction module protein [Rhodoferax sp.]OIP17245.1 MAG: hypothetical protein AUK50_07715 [Comamonadaceae bacterium CG2_30_57_122]PIZ21560.1 MAG: addiction module protein [Comamonadaceae bacterium CG_4_10_14_0_8_um_filter_57_29]PJC13086.1 MAG: addiction module protein [Comamonadaceae bacterium CG_4_9_14_0_8_um_filter_57_21]
MQTQEIIAEACKLDWSGRYEIAQIMLESLAQPDDVIDPRWEAMLNSRLEAYRSGLVVGIPAEEVLGPL